MQIDIIAVKMPQYLIIFAVKLLHTLNLHNPNIAYVLGDADVNKGNLRESVFLCWTKEKFEVLGSEFSDFEIEDYTFEIGGKTKGKHQLGGANKGYGVKDNIEYAVGKDIPLWMFGFLY